MISRVAIIVKINQFATNKLREMQRNKKSLPHWRGEKKKWTEDVPKDAQALHLLDKNFKLIVINMFKQLKESFLPWITNKTPFVFSIILEVLARVTRQVKEKAFELKRKSEMISIKNWHDLYIEEILRNTQTQIQQSCRTQDQHTKMSIFLYTNYN